MPKKARTACPTDLRAPGAINELLAFHRSVFGDARMGPDGGEGGEAATTETTTTEATSPATEATTTVEQTTATSEKVEDLPAWAQKIIADSRADAGKARTTAKQAAADEAKQQLAQEIGKALGLVKGNEKPNPDELAKQVAEAQNTARQTSVELAVYKTASKHSGDPDALLDSRAFLAKVKDLDPTANDFASKVDEAIKSAVAENPKLKAVQATGSSSVHHAGGSGEQTTRTPKPLDQAVSGHYGT